MRQIHNATIAKRTGRRNQKIAGMTRSYLNQSMRMRLTSPIRKEMLFVIESTAKRSEGRDSPLSVERRGFISFREDKTF